MCTRKQSGIRRGLHHLVSAVTIVLLVAFVAPTKGQIIVPGADGSDGPLNCGTLQQPPIPNYPCGVPCANTSAVTYTIDLSAAANRNWNVPGPAPRIGVYDSEKWAVVYKYSCVDIPSYVTIKFKNHPSGAPVVWLVSGDVVINGTINLSGQQGTTAATFTEPGPGGFRGGSLWLSELSMGSAGFGPGGGPNASGCRAHGSFGEEGHSQCDDQPPTYGNARLIPLIGGSGGSNSGAYSAGAGGGAILIASTGTISISGDITANGGSSGDYDGSGGGIRLVADSVTDGGSGPGTLTAQGPSNAGAGRIRIEANTIQLASATDPAFTWDYPGPTAVVWASDLVDAPTVRVLSIGGQGVPTDPRAGLDFPQADVTLTNLGVQPVVLEAHNVPLDWLVDVRVVPKQGKDSVFPAAYLSGDATMSTWQASVRMTSGFSAIQVRAYDPTASQARDASQEQDGTVSEE